MPRKTLSRKTKGRKAAKKTVSSSSKKSPAATTTRRKFKSRIASSRSSLKVTKRGKEKSRYSDEELMEFRRLIDGKLDASRKELKYMQDQISRVGSNGTDDTENKYLSLDDSSASMEREYLTQMAARQQQFIDHLEKALIRIRNKTYGICRATGKLISKERLRAVPHATLSIDAKKAQKA